MRSAWARFTGPGVSRSATGSPRRSEASGGYAGPYQGPGQSRSIEQRHGWAGALPSVGGYGGAISGPRTVAVNRAAPRLGRGAAERWRIRGAISGPRTVAVNRAAPRL